MAESKTPEMVSSLDIFSVVARNRMVIHLYEIEKASFGRGRSDSITSGYCVTCGDPATSFKDVVSAKEYNISGMCQTCQDKIFC